MYVVSYVSLPDEEDFYFFFSKKRKKRKRQWNSLIIQNKNYYYYVFEDIHTHSIEERKSLKVGGGEDPRILF